jgi:thioredoxin reductase
MSETATDVLIIGGGPSGLTAAAALAPQLGDRVLVLEREAVAGGIPRHCDHLGFGVRDLRTFASGPAYARRLAAGALRAGARVRTEAMATGWVDQHTVEVTSPAGRERIAARAIILATGARERPRSARLVAGDRTAGVYTTGQLQNLVHLHHRSPGARAVIVGAEQVSWSAALTLREAGCRPFLMTTTHPRPESYGALSIGGRLALRLEVLTRTRVVEIAGRDRVRAVELEQLDTGMRRTVSCDTVVFTGDWIPDGELARAAGLEVAPDTLGPLVDTAHATTTPGIFAIGNLVHPVAAADLAALDGRAVAAAVLRFLGAGAAGTRNRGPRVLAGANLKWVSPGLLDPAAHGSSWRLLCWPSHQFTRPTITVSQRGDTLAHRRLAWPASPGRVYQIRSSLLADVDLDGPDVRVDLGV